MKLEQMLQLFHPGYAHGATVCIMYIVRVSGEYIEQRRFPCAGRPQDTRQLAGPELAWHVVEYPTLSCKQINTRLNYMLVHQFFFVPLLILSLSNLSLDIGPNDGARFLFRARYPSLDGASYAL